MYAYARNVEAVSLGQAMKWCVTPFVPFDLIKMALAIIISDRVKKYAHL
ncbi:MAG: biotin transporter BioY, partial [Ruminococcus sp.]|nr:biotin transporter BioY [Ruminococcus sp.]